jgi:hypothetical protein
MVLPLGMSGAGNAMDSVSSFGGASNPGKKRKASKKRKSAKKRKK